MARGIAKKIYTAAKRKDKSRSEIIAEIRSTLSESGKLDDVNSKILNELEEGI